mgnify:CR=1 FL=1
MSHQSSTPSRLILRKKEWNDKEPWQRSEHQVFLLLDGKLDSGWEIFHNPSLGQGRPDFVLASKSHGAVIIEVKCWDFSGVEVIKGSGGNSKISFKSKKWIKNEDPITQLYRYQKKLEERCYSSYRASPFIPKTVLIFLHKKNTKYMAEQLLEKIRKINNSNALIMLDVICTDEIRANKFDIERILPPKLSRPLDGKTWNLLNYSLGAVKHIEVPGYDWRFNDKQNELIETRNESGFRRIKGVAGSGKSVILANRAVKLASEGKNVLIICYNITLVNLLHLMVIKAAKKRGGIQDLSNIRFIHFHGWVKDIAYWTGNRDQYNVWSSFKIQNSRKKIAENSIVIKEWIKDSDYENKMYDAIFVDEGQDFCLEWWDALKMTLKPKGEMILVADANQDLYGRSENWTEKQMKGSGFLGPWVSLKSAYRFPKHYHEFLASFCETFLGVESIPEPPLEQRTLADFKRVDIEWRDLSSKGKIDDSSNFDIIFHDIERYLESNSEYSPDGTVDESVLLVFQNKLGKKITTELGTKRDIQHTFSNVNGEKLSFTHHKSQLKATTFHSFKGWEASHLIIIVGKCKTIYQKRGFYTALSRLKPSISSRRESILILCGDDKLSNWYRDLNK